MLTGFMQGFDPNRDFVQRMRKLDIEREVRKYMNPSGSKTPLQVTAGKTYSSTAGNGSDGFWISDAAKQHQEQLDAQEMEFTGGGLQRYRAHATPTNAPSDKYFNTAEEANQYAGIRSMPEQLRGIGAIHGRYGDADAMMKYMAQAQWLERGDEQYARQKQGWEREDAEYNSAQGLKKALTAAQSIADPAQRAAAYRAAYTQHAPEKTDEQYLNQLKAQSAAMQLEATDVFRQRGLDGLVEWFSHKDTGTDFKIVRGPNGSVELLHIKEGTNEVVDRQPFPSEMHATAAVNAMIEGGSKSFIELAKLMDARRKADMDQQYHMGSLALRGSGGAGGGQGVTPQSISLTDVNNFLKIQGIAPDLDTGQYTPAQRAAINALLNEANLVAGMGYNSSTALIMASNKLNTAAATTPPPGDATGVPDPASTAKPAPAAPKPVGSSPGLFDNPEDFRLSGLANIPSPPSGFGHFTEEHLKNPTWVNNPRFRAWYDKHGEAWLKAQRKLK
jgi:hypothetical protein